MAIIGNIPYFQTHPFKRKNPGMNSYWKLRATQIYANKRKSDKIASNMKQPLCHMTCNQTYGSLQIISGHVLKDISKRKSLEHVFHFWIRSSLAKRPSTSTWIFSFAWGHRKSREILKVFGVFVQVNQWAPNWKGLLTSATLFSCREEVGAIHEEVSRG